MKKKAVPFFVWVPALLVSGVFVLWGVITNSFVFDHLLFNVVAHLVFWTSVLTVVSTSKSRSAIAAAVLLLLLVGLRAVGWGEWNVRDVDQLFPMLTWVSSAAAAFLLHSEKKDAAIASEQKWSWKKDGALLAILLLLGIVVTAVNLGDRNFQNDEFLHVEAARGYSETGKFILWNDVSDGPYVDQHGEQNEYTRAVVYTVQTVAMMRLADAYEWSEEVLLRLPSIAWYMALLIGVYTALWFWTKNRTLAALTTLTVLFMDGVVFHSRIVRMYSMLMFLGGAAMVSWYSLYRLWQAGPAKWSSGRFVAVAALTMLLSGLALMTHLVFALFFFALLGFVFFEYYYFRKTRDRGQAQRVLWWVLAGVVGLVVLLAIDAAWNVIPWQHIGIRKKSNFVYEVLPFANFPLLAFAAAIYSIGVWKACLKAEPHQRFMAITSALVIVLFVLFVKRYNAMRYILFIIPFVAATSVLTVWPLLQGVGSALTKKWNAVMTSAVLALLLIPVSIPGLELGGILLPARADRVHENGIGHHFDKAYAVIQEQRQESEPVFAQSLRSIYWGSDTVEIVDLGKNKSLSLDELQELLLPYESVWFVWANGKTHHMRKKVRRFIQRNSIDKSNDPAFAGTNMSVYYYTAPVAE